MISTPVEQNMMNTLSKGHAQQLQQQQKSSSAIQVDNHVVIVANQTKTKANLIDAERRLQRQRSVSSSTNWPTNSDEKTVKTMRSLSSSTQENKSTSSPPLLMQPTATTATTTHSRRTALTRDQGAFKINLKKLPNESINSSTTTITPRSLSSAAPSSPSYANSSATNVPVFQKNYMCSTSIIDILIIMMRYKETCEQLIDLVAPSNLLEHNNKFFQSRFNCYNNLYSVSLINLINSCAVCCLLIQICSFLSLIFSIKFRRYLNLSTYILTTFWLVRFKLYFFLFFYY
jgi:hypothetical protein